MFRMDFIENGRENKGEGGVCMLIFRGRVEYDGVTMVKDGGMPWLLWKGVGRTDDR